MKETITVKYGDGSTESFQREDPANPVVNYLIMSQEPHFNGHEFIMSHDVMDAYQVIWEHGAADVHRVFGAVGNRVPEWVVFSKDI